MYVATKCLKQGARKESLVVNGAKMGTWETVNSGHASPSVEVPKALGVDAGISDSETGCDMLIFFGASPSSRSIAMDNPSSPEISVATTSWGNPGGRNP